MERNHPFIYLYGNASSNDNSEDAKVHIAYGRERKEPGRERKEPGRGDDADWICTAVRHSEFTTKFHD